MANQFYIKFLSFLRNHNLHDIDNFKYIWSQAAFIDATDDDYNFLLGGCVNIIDKNGKLQGIVPCLPNLVNDKMVAVSVYGYVQALTQLTRLNKKYKSNIYYSYILPMFYEKLFILENSSDELLTYEENMRKKLLKDNSFDYKLVLETVDDLIEKYNKGKLDDKKMARKTRRLAKIYINTWSKK